MQISQSSPRVQNAELTVNALPDVSCASFVSKTHGLSAAGSKTRGHELGPRLTYVHVQPEEVCCLGLRVRFQASLLNRRLTVTRASQSSETARTRMLFCFCISHWCHQNKHPEISDVWCKTKKYIHPYIHIPALDSLCPCADPRLKH